MAVAGAAAGALPEGRRFHVDLVVVARARGLVLELGGRLLLILGGCGGSVGIGGVGRLHKKTRIQMEMPIFF